MDQNGDAVGCVEAGLSSAARRMRSRPSVAGSPCVWRPPGVAWTAFHPVLPRLSDPCAKVLVTCRDDDSRLAGDARGGRRSERQEGA